MTKFLILISLLFLFCSRPEGPDVAGSGSRAGNALVGRVYQDPNTPAAGALVKAYKIGENAGNYEVFWSKAGERTANSAGEYEFKDLEIGNYSIEAVLDSLKMFVPGLVMPDDETTVTVPDSLLMGTGVLQGIVDIKRPDSTSVQFVAFAVGTPYADTTDINGNFVLESLPDGVFELLFIPVEIQDTLVMPDTVFIDGVLDSTITVIEGDTTTVDIIPPDTSSIVDSVPPILAITTAAQTVTVDSILIQGTASDSAGVDSVTVDGLPAAGTTSWSLKIELSQGPNNVMVEVWDINGNSITDSVTITYNPPVVDNTPPALSITTAPQTVNTDSILVEGTASDSAGIDSVTVMGQTASGTTSWSLKIGLSPGPNNVFVIVWDINGNRTSDSIQVTYTPSVPVDTTPPIIVITTPPQTVDVNSILIQGTASDSAGIDSVTVNDIKATGTTSWSLSVGLNTGGNNIVVKVWDINGNEIIDSVMITYQPIVTDFGTVRGVVRDHNSSPVSGVKAVVYRTGLSGVSDAGGNYTITNVPVGNHAIGFLYTGMEITTYETTMSITKGNTTVIDGKVPQAPSQHLRIPPNDSSAMIAVFSFDEGAGTSLVDSSLNGNTGTTGTAARVSSPIGEALSFTSNTYSDISILTPYNGFVVINFWLYIDDSTGIHGTNKVEILKVGNVDIYFIDNFITAEAGGPLLQVPAAIVAFQKWIKVIVYLSSGGGEIMVDYEYDFVGGFLFMNTAENINSITIGSKTGQGFTGHIDELRVWKNE